MIQSGPESQQECYLPGLACKTYPGGALCALSSLGCWARHKGYNGATWGAKEQWMLKNLCPWKTVWSKTELDRSEQLLCWASKIGSSRQPGLTSTSGLARLSPRKLLFSSYLTHLTYGYYFLEGIWVYNPSSRLFCHSVRKINIAEPQFAHLWNDGLDHRVSKAHTIYTCHTIATG